jgi:hypothetical protein
VRDEVYDSETVDEANFQPTFILSVIVLLLVSDVEFESVLVVEVVYVKVDVAPPYPTPTASHLPFV